MAVLLAVLHGGFHGLFDGRVEKISGQVAGGVQVRLHHVRRIAWRTYSVSSTGLRVVTAASPRLPEW